MEAFAADGVIQPLSDCIGHQYSSCGFRGTEQRALRQQRTQQRREEETDEEVETDGEGSQAGAAALSDAAGALNITAHGYNMRIWTITHKRRCQGADGR